MAPKRSSPLDEPPPAASSAEEEDTSSSDDDLTTSEEEEDDAEETQTLNPKIPSALPPTPVTEKKPASKKPEPAVVSQPHQSSSSETDSGSDSDTEVESGQNVKPISSKPMDETLQVKKPRSKPSASAPPARSALKRPSETTKDPKRAKKSSDGDAEDGVAAEKSADESKKLFQRLWSEDDEIVILNSIIEHFTSKGLDPALDMNAFYDSIKKSIHVDVTKAQLVDKIRRLKKKYRNNAERGKKGADPTFSKHHEQKGFELSKRIWGDGGIARTPAVEQLKANSNANANGTPKKIQRGSTSKTLAPLKADLFPSQDAQKEDDKMKVDDNQAPPSGCIDGFVAFERSLGGVGLPESFLKPGLELIGQSKRTELEEEWKKLHVAELELFLKRTELIRDQAKLILEAYKSSDKDGRKPPKYKLEEGQKKFNPSSFNTIRSGRLGGLNHCFSG